MATKTHQFRCTFCRRPIHRQRSGTWYHTYNASVSCRPGWSSNKATPAGTGPSDHSDSQPIGPEPRSLGGDLPISRRCHRGQHADCLGSWTAYPDQGGPCECPCHCRTAPAPEAQR